MQLDPVESQRIRCAIHFLRISVHKDADFGNLPGNRSGNLLRPLQVNKPRAARNKIQANRICTGLDR